MLVRLQPCIPICEDPSGGLDLAVERRRVVAIEFRDRGPIKRLDYLYHGALRLLEQWPRRVVRRPGFPVRKVIKQVMGST
jgi:hypothetical protein